MSLQSLAAFAVANNNAKSASRATKYWELDAVELREFAKVKDGNRKLAEDGGQALVITLGKVRVDLDAIAPKATRVNATAEQVEEFTNLLEDAIGAGDFDEALLDAAEKLNPANKVANVTDSGVEADTPSDDVLAQLG
mgnify:CR=1